MGIEDELMLLDPETLELLPHGSEALGRVAGDQRFKLELPAAHLEIVTTPQATVAAAVEELHLARRELASALSGLAIPASAGVHPFSCGVGDLNHLERYRHTRMEYGPVATRQLVCALQVHVALGDAETALAVYNAARSYLPALAALAANAPFYEGCDTGLASVRPLLCVLLPRQGIPPPIQSWEQYAADLQWGQVSERFQPGAWWWELRPHHRHGTLEFRVPDGQSAVGNASAIAAVVQALVAWLAGRHAAGERLAIAPSWRIAENRWSAARHGVEGEFVHLEHGDRRPTREVLHELLKDLEPVAGSLGSSAELALARRLVERNGAIAQREVGAQSGPSGIARWLAERFLEDWAATASRPS